MSIVFNTTVRHTIANYSFGLLSKEVLQDVYKDGRPFSYLIERYISTVLFPQLTWVPGCKTHDFIDNNEEKYDEKTFTKYGCGFMPSNMRGGSRSFDQEKLNEHAPKLNYIIVDNIDFPQIKIKFMRGTDLLQLYPKGQIPLKDRTKFFTD